MPIAGDDYCPSACRCFGRTGTSLLVGGGEFVSDLYTPTPGFQSQIKVDRGMVVTANLGEGGGGSSKLCIGYAGPVSFYIGDHQL